MRLWLEGQLQQNILGLNMLNLHPEAYERVNHAVSEEMGPLRDRMTSIPSPFGSVDFEKSMVDNNKEEWNGFRLCCFEGMTLWQKLISVVDRGTLGVVVIAGTMVLQVSDSCPPRV